jgi:SOS-response transcriptional repressor LexA
MSRKKQTEVSQKQLELYRFLVHHIEENGYQPSHTEMADAFGVTKRAILDRLRQLEAKGLIEPPEAGRERAIRLKYVRFQAVHARDAPAC